MKKTILSLLLLLVTSCATGLPMTHPTQAPKTMTLTSPDFADGAPLAARHAFSQYGCTGDNVAPKLTWDNVPQGTKSFALIVHDPDAPTGVGFFHWVLVDLPADARTLTTPPPGARALHTDYGVTGYGGPCPPPGAPHRYVFTLYALDVERLQVPEGATGALTRFVLASHALAIGRLVGTFAR